MYRGGRTVKAKSPKMISGFLPLLSDSLPMGIWVYQLDCSVHRDYETQQRVGGTQTYGVQRKNGCYQGEPQDRHEDREIEREKGACFSLRVS